MRSELTALPIQVSSAINALKESLSHFLLYKYNFPFEASLCIPQLAQCMELLLGHLDLPNKSMSLHGMIDEHSNWVGTEKEVAHWIRRRRNKILHAGEPPWEDLITVRSKTQAALQICAKLLLDSGYPIRHHFSIVEIPLLEGKSPYSHDEAAWLVQAAYGYTDIDPEVAVDIANGAFEISLREFAASWGIDDSLFSTVDDLISELRKDDDPEIPEKLPYYEFRVDDGALDKELEQRNIGDTGLSPPKSFAGLESLMLEATEQDLRSIIQRYILEVQRAITSFAERSPLRVYKSLRNNWQAIMATLRELRPNIDMPDMDFDRLEQTDFMYRKMRLLVKPGSPLPIWDANDVQSFLEIVTDQCGAIPEGVEIEFSHGIIFWG